MIIREARTEDIERILEIYAKFMKNVATRSLNLT